MKLRNFSAVAVMACVAMFATTAVANNWQGPVGSGLFTDAANWDFGSVPASATDRHQVPANTDSANEARNKIDGANISIGPGDNIEAFSIQIGHPKEGIFGSQASSNTLNMTGGSITQQGNFLFNVGRGTNVLPGQLVQFNMSGGVVNSSGITVPEAFGPGVGSVGINAEMHVSGNSVVNTDLLRLGAQDSNSYMTISDNAVVNLTDDNNGFAGGVLWIEAFEFTPGDLSGVLGSSLLDIQDNGVLNIHGEWWTDENGDTMRGAATQTEADYIEANYVGNGWIQANGGANAVDVSFSNGVITLQVGGAAVPEPTSAILLLMSASSLVMVRRRK